MGPVVLDANVVIGYLDGADALHERAVTALQERLDAPLLMSTLAYAETLVHPLRRGRAQLVEDFVARGRVELVPVDRGVAREAASIRSRLGSVGLGDAAVLATALLRGADLLTFDASVAEAWAALR